MAWFLSSLQQADQAIGSDAPVRKQRGLMQFSLSLRQQTRQNANTVLPSSSKPHTKSASTSTTRKIHRPLTSTCYTTIKCTLAPLVQDIIPQTTLEPFNIMSPLQSFDRSKRTLPSIPTAQHKIQTSRRHETQRTEASDIHTARATSVGTDGGLESHLSKPSAPDVYISYCSTTGRLHALEIKHRLEQAQARVFLRHSTEGHAGACCDDEDTLKRCSSHAEATCVEALASCSLAVILGTKGYGSQATTESSTGAPNVEFSSFDEMQYIVTHEKPCVLIQMCAQFDHDETRRALSATIPHLSWFPACATLQAPDDLVYHILGKLRCLQSAHAEPHAATYGDTMDCLVQQVMHMRRELESLSQQVKQLQAHPQPPLS
eukprot:m.8054 g.8054  ORF g.8054 m.8054 type:complete len:375 (-) comp5313_c1_seq1:47-1171(-)